MSIGRTIFQQLGGGKFIAMTGAKYFLETSNGLMFAIPSRLAKNKSNKIRITLDSDDTYTVEFLKVSGHNFKEVSKHSLIYGDMLQELFEQETGLATSLTGR